MSVCDYSVNKCSGMLFTLLLRMGLCNSINKLSFRHSIKSFRAPPITRKLFRVALQLSRVALQLSRAALQLLQLMWFKLSRVALHFFRC